MDRTPSRGDEAATANRLAVAASASGPQTGFVTESNARDRFDPVRTAMHRLLAFAGVPVSGRTAPAAGTELHYLHVPARCQMGAPPLLLIHGGGGGGANWFRMLAGLSEQRPVYAPDLPGFGLSPAVGARPPLGRQAAAILLEWMTAIGIDRADVIGTSFGGLTALRLAQAAPERIRKVVALDTAGLGPDAPLLLRVGTLRVLRRFVAASSEAGQRFMLRTLLTSDRSELEGPMEDALVSYLHASAAAQPFALPDALSGFARWRGQREVLSDAELRAFPRPLLIAWGEADRFFSVEHGRRAAAICGAELAVIPAAGHSPNWERPQLLLSSITPFLQARPSR